MNDHDKQLLQEQAKLERGPPAGPEPGLRHESFWKDMTPSEQELTEVALLQALAIHVEHEAVRGVSKHQVVPLDRTVGMSLPTRKSESMHLLPMVPYVVFHAIPTQVIIRLLAQHIVRDVTSTFQKGI